ncbi:hypothetical protein V2S66_33055 [Streptomyces sp. V4-01]|uniref:C1q domain-containing protein n=1 Tax=Actinacidiphila polyblastidii TaxID=3110430 RepID=A0ABU7PLS6_9ACTN|nr:hypothetical protein [Streptomyces sp. V4-01]
MGRTVPSPPTETPGIYQTSALWNAQVRDLNNFALGAPVFAGYASSSQSIPGSNAMTALTLDTERFDLDGGHSTVTNTSRYTATVPGTYFVIATVGWSANATGDRRLQVGLNGAAVIGSGVSFDPSQVVLCGMQTSAFVTMNGSTDYVEAMAAHTAGTTLSTTGGGVFAPSLCVLWISR